MIFFSKKTYELSKKEISKILELKDQSWSYGNLSQEKFFKKNIKKKDLHNLLFKSKKKDILLGYTCFRLRKFLRFKKYFNFMLLDTIIVRKEFRKKNIGKKMMFFNNSLIKKRSCPSILFCKSKNINFFKLYKWKKISNTVYTVQNADKNKQYACMVFNFQIPNAKIKQQIMKIKI